MGMYMKVVYKKEVRSIQFSLVKSIHGVKTNLAMQKEVVRRGAGDLNQQLSTCQEFSPGPGWLFLSS